MVINEGEVLLTLEEKTGRRARLKVEASVEVKIQTIKTSVLMG